MELPSILPNPLSLEIGLKNLKIIESLYHGFGFW